MDGKIAESFPYLSEAGIFTDYKVRLVLGKRAAELIRTLWRLKSLFEEIEAFSFHQYHNSPLIRRI